MMPIVAGHDCYTCNRTFTYCKSCGRRRVDAIVLDRSFISPWWKADRNEWRRMKTWWKRRAREEAWPSELLAEFLKRRAKNYRDNRRNSIRKAR